MLAAAEGEDYVHWRKQAWEARKTGKKVNFDNLLSSYKPASSSTVSSTSDPFLQQVSQELDLEINQANQLLQEIKLWTPSSDITLALVLDEYYSDRLAGIQLLVDHIAENGRNIGHNIELAVQLVEDLVLVSPKTRRQELRQKEILALLRGLAGVNLAKHSAAMFSVFARQPNLNTALVRAWYTLLLPLTPPAHVAQYNEENKYFDLFVSPDEFVDPVDWFVSTLESLFTAFAGVEATTEKLATVERKVLRNYMERHFVSGFASKCAAQSADARYLLDQVCALGFGKTEVFACDAFWAGQYPGLFAYYSTAGDNVMLAAAGFTKRQHRSATVSLVSRDLSSVKDDLELCAVRTSVIQVHSRLLDSTPSRRPLVLEQQSIAGILLRYILASENKQGASARLAWELLVCDAVDCLVTLCKVSQPCREMVMRCSRATQVAGTTGGKNYLLQVLIAYGSALEEYTLELVRSVLELEPTVDASFQRDCTQFALRTHSLALVPLLGQIPEAYLFEQVSSMCCNAVLSSSFEKFPEATLAMQHLLAQKKPIPQANTQRMVLALFRRVGDPHAQRLLSALLQSITSPFLGLLGPEYLPQSTENLVATLEDGEDALFALLLALCSKEPELVRMFIQFNDKFLPTLLGVTLCNENEPVLQQACALVHCILDKFQIPIDPAYFTSLHTLYETLEVERHLPLKTEIIYILAHEDNVAVPLAATCFPTSTAFPAAEYDLFLQAWAKLLSSKQQQQQQVEEIWQVLCSQLAAYATTVPNLTLLLVQLLESSLLFQVEDRELQLLALAAQECESVANVFILACAKGANAEKVEEMRQFLLPTACDWLLRCKSRALFAECCGVNAYHALLPECFTLLLINNVQQEQEEWTLRVLIRASTVHAPLLVSLNVFQKLLLVSTNTNLPLKFALASALLEHTQCSAQALQFSQAYSKQMLAELGKFHAKESKLTLGSLQFCKEIVRFLRLGGRSADTLLQACFWLIRDLVCGSSGETTLPPMLEEFAEQCHCEERKRQPKRTSQIIVRSLAETKQEIAWNEAPMPQTKPRRSSSSFGGSLDSSMHQQQPAHVESPFRRRGSNNLSGFFNEQPETPKPFLKSYSSSSMASTPGVNAIVAVDTTADKSTRVSMFHLKIEEEIESLLLELLLLFYPMMKQKMLLFVLDASVNDKLSPDVSTLLSMLRWIARSWGGQVVPANKSRLACMTSICLYEAINLITEQQQQQSNKAAWQYVQLHLCEKRLLGKVAKRLSPTNGSLVNKIEEEILQLL